MDLISDHMLQSLVISGTKEDLDFKSLSCESTVHSFVTVSLVAELVESVGDFTHSLSTERSGITFVSIQTDDLR